MVNMTSSITGLSSTTLLRASKLKERIENLTRDLERILGGTVAVAKKAASGPRAMKGRKRKMSKAARAEQSARMKKQWAKVKAAGKNAL
jgi:hypothetical protein